ncbi:hypothetical protein [Halomicrococcus sp. NG-SE-24]|uniref:hypothetical protein n=1 Tax=unclassified Halomicrococcus TaxID=2614448 RepID=UPI000DDE6C21|nr:hypothetical protein DMJ13_01310 [halophilic archaeon]
MDETKRRRLAGIWLAFAVLMAYITLADGFVMGVGDLLGLLVALLGVALAVVYYLNPSGLLSLDST